MTANTLASMQRNRPYTTKERTRRREPAGKIQFVPPSSLAATQAEGGCNTNRESKAYQRRPGRNDA